MLSAIFIALFASLAFLAIAQAQRSMTPISQKVSGRLQKLWDVAQQGMADKNNLRAEKALLTILKLDQTNAAAYNRLGILYSRQKEFKDAIECFEIASSIQPSASSLHNLGLIYYETENYEKAAAAFEKSIELEDNLAARHIAYAKVQEKLGNDSQVLASLEKAADMEPNKQTVSLLLDAFKKQGHLDDAKKAQVRLNRLKTSKKAKRVKKPKRVIY